MSLVITLPPNGMTAVCLITLSKKTAPESQIAVESKFSARGSVHPYVKLPPEAILI